jgi:hypothetical protein
MLEKIKPLVENSKSFGILLDKNPEEHEFLAQEALKEAIRSRGIPVLSLPETHEELQKKWGRIIKPTALFDFPQKTAIKLPKEKYGIKEVAYKEDQDNLSLIITSSNALLSNEEISIEKLSPETEAIFCIFENHEKLEMFKTFLQLPESDRIVFISADEKTLTEKISLIIKLFEPRYLENKEVATLLFASLLVETNNLYKKGSKEIFSFASLLIENRADKEAVSEIMDHEKKPSFVQIIGRLLART